MEEDNSLGTTKQLTSFFEKYRNFREMSGECALDGRYFWKVLHPYGGLVRSELYIRINDLPQSRLQISPVAWDYRELEENQSTQRYKLVKMILDLSSDPKDNNGSVHSNLIYFDTKIKEIVRFEPMFEDKYTEPINDTLKKYFKDLFPEYRYRMRKDHPQLPITEKCPRKGFCAAYTLKAAMMLVNGKNLSLDRDPKLEEEKIMIFARAIQKEYGEFDDAEEEDNFFEEEKDEYGRWRHGFYRRRHLGLGRRRGFGAGAVVGAGLLGLVAGSFINLNRPNYVAYTPEDQPDYPLYPAPYYGYRYGPRYGGSPGWGWARGSQYYGHEESTNMEASGEHGCGCGGSTRKLSK